MLCADATSTVLLKYALSASSCSSSANWRFVVERLMLITSKPCSTAQRSPASRTGPLPLKPAPSTRTLWSSQSGASAADDPGAGRAVAAEVALGVVHALDLVVLADGGRRLRPATSPTSGWPASTPLSRMQTRTPLPVAPPNAQSRVTRSGQSTPIEIRSPAPAGRLQAGRSAGSLTRLIVSG